MFEHIARQIYFAPVAILPATFDAIDRQFTAILEQRLRLDPMAPRDSLAAACRALQPYPVRQLSAAQHFRLSSVSDRWDPNDRAEDDPLPLCEFNPRTGVGLLRVWGVIGKHLSWLDAACGGCDLATIDRAIDTISAHHGLRALVVDFRSPGGSVAGVMETAEKLRSLAVPTYAYTEDMCASAAYWLASACQGGIFSPPSATVGSIGVYCAAIDRSAQLEAAGVAVRVFRTGPYKAVNLMGRGINEAEAARLQAGVDSVFADFLTALDTGRKLDSYDPEALKGEAWMATHAPRGVTDAADVPTLADFLGLVASMHS